MAGDIASLGLKVDSSQAVKATEALERLTKAGSASETAVGKLGSQARQAGSNVDGFAAKSRQAGTATNFLVGALKGLALGKIATDIISAADGYSRMNSRLALVVTSSQSFARTQNELFSIAQRSRAPLGSVVNLYTDLARSTASLGVSQRELMTLTATVGNSLTISGTSAQAASGGLRQLGQAFSSGVLRGDEFNSVMEQMPRLQQAIATSLGKTTGELRAMAAEGKLNVETILPAILKQSKAIQAEFDSMPQTVEQSMTKIGNSLLKIIGTTDKATGFTKNLADAMDRLSAAADSPLDAFAASAAKLRIDDLNKDLDDTIKSMEAVKPSAEAGFSGAQIQYDRLGTKAKEINRELTDTINLLKNIGNSRASPFSGPKTADEQAASDAAAKATRTKAALDQFEKDELKFRSAGEQRAALVKFYTDLGVAANVSDARTRQLIARATGKIADPGASKALREAEAATKRLAALDIKFGQKDLGSDIAKIERTISDLTSFYDNQLSVLEALRSAGLEDEESYYNKRRDLLNKDTEAQIEGLEAQNVRLDEEIAIQQRRRDESIAAGMDRVEAEKRYMNEEVTLTRKQIENLVAIQRARGKLDTQETILTIEQTTAKKRLATSIRELRETQEDYLQTQIEAQTMQVASLGMGDRERDRLTGLAQINEKYSKQALATTRELAAAQTDKQREALQEQLKIIKEFHGKAIDEYQKYWDQLGKRQQDAGVGAREAISNYVADAENLAKSTQSILGTSLEGVGDGLANLVIKGENTFRDLADTILMEMTRVLAKQGIAQLLKMISGQGAGGSFAFGAEGNQAIANQAFASGGVFNGSGLITSPTRFRFANGSGLMGEAGPEAVMPLKRGRDGRLGIEGGVGGNMTIQNNLTVSGVQGNPTTKELQRLMEQSSRNAIANARGRNGRL